MVLWATANSRLRALVGAMSCTSSDNEKTGDTNDTNDDVSDDESVIVGDPDVDDDGLLRQIKAIVMMETLFFGRKINDLVYRRNQALNPPFFQ